jgi:hypothetical protein
MLPVGLANGLRAADYHADAVSGNDMNDGLSPETAWRTLSKVNSKVFESGDRLLLRSGTRFEGCLNPKGSGTADHPIVIDRYGTGAKPAIDGAGLVNAALLLQNVEFWEVSNLEITNTGPTPEPRRRGVFLHLRDFGVARHIHLKNLDVFDVNGSNVKSAGGGAGIEWYNEGTQTPSRFDDLLIEGCHLVRTDRNGIIGGSAYWQRSKWLPSLRVVIRGNLLEDIGGDGIVPIGTDGCLVEYNVLRGGRQRAEDYCAGIWPWSCDNTVVQHNEVSGMKGTKDGQGFDSDWNCHNTIIQYNYSHDNDGGFLLICDNGGAGASVGNVGTMVRYNISQNDATRTFHLAGPISGTKIYNNTIYVKAGMSVQLILYSNWNGWARDTLFCNNIFYVDGAATIGYATKGLPDGTYEGAPGLGPTVGNVFQNNVFFHGFYQYIPPDANAILSDPRIFQPGGARSHDPGVAYQLRPGSPCINSGVLMEDNDVKDFLGNSVSGVPDRGAVEFAGPRARRRTGRAGHD